MEGRRKVQNFMAQRPTRIIIRAAQMIRTISHQQVVSGDNTGRTEASLFGSRKTHMDTQVGLLESH